MPTVLDKLEDLQRTFRNLRRWKRIGFAVGIAGLVVHIGLGVTLLSSWGGWLNLGLIPVDLFCLASARRLGRLARGITDE